jgi:hypothetical protein
MTVEPSAAVQIEPVAAPCKPPFSKNANGMHVLAAGSVAPFATRVPPPLA